MSGRPWRSALVGLASAWWAACGSSPAYLDTITWTSRAPGVPIVVRLIPAADVTVHNGERWKDRSLADQPWLMVGSNGTGDVWFTYLTFDLSAVTPGTLPDSATLSLMANTSLVLPQDGQDLDVNVWVVNDEWTESNITWQAQPRILTTAAHTFTVRPGSSAERVDLGELVSDCLLDGCTRLSVLLTPADPSRDFRIRWFSREAPVAGDPSAAQTDTVDFARLDGPSPWVLRNGALQLSLELEWMAPLGTEPP